MNLILLRDFDFVSPDEVLIQGDRARHLREVISCALGQSLQVAEIQGRRGAGEVLELGDNAIRLRVSWLADGRFQGVPLDLLLAIPRPKVLARVLEHAASLGIRRIFLIRSWHVDKAYLSSRVLEEERLREHLLQGLEQGGHTSLPEVRVIDRFRPFVEDQIPTLIADSTALLAQPQAENPLSSAAGKLADSAAVMLAIGPERGFTTFECELLKKAGFTGVSLGNSVLRVEVACVFGTAQIRLLTAKRAGI